MTNVFFIASVVTYVLCMLLAYWLVGKSPFAVAAVVTIAFAVGAVVAVVADSRLEIVVGVVFMVMASILMAMI